MFSSHTVSYQYQGEAGDTKPIGALTCANPRRSGVSSHRLTPFDDDLLALIEQYA